MDNEHIETIYSYNEYNNLLLFIFFNKYVKETNKIPQGGKAEVITFLFKKILTSYFKQTDKFKETPLNITNLFIDDLYKIQQDKTINGEHHYHPNNYNEYDLYNYIYQVLQNFKICSTSELNTYYTYLKNYTKYKNDIQKFLSNHLFIKYGGDYTYEISIFPSMIKYLYFKIKNTLSENFIKNMNNYFEGDSIILNYYSLHATALYIHKISEDKYDFYRINTNMKPSIVKSKYTTKKDIIRVLMSILCRETLIQYEDLDTIFNIDTKNIDIPFNNIVQQNNTCYFYSILLSVLIYLYKNKSNIKYILNWSRDLTEEYFNKNNSKLGLDMVPEIIQLFFYYAYDMFIKVKEFNNKIIDNNTLSYYNFIYVSLNEVYKSYKNFYKQNNKLEIFKNSGTIETLIQPKEYIKSLRNIYIKIHSLLIKNYPPMINNFNLKYISTNNTQNNYIINNINEFNYDNELLNPIQKIQLYHMLKENIENLLYKYDNTSPDNFQNIYISYLSKNDIKLNKHNIDVLYNKKIFNNKIQDTYKYINKNIFLPLSDVYDQFISIIMMYKTICIYQNKKTTAITPLNFEQIQENIYNIFKISKKDYNNYEIILNLLISKFKGLKSPFLTKDFNNSIDNIINNIFDFQKKFIHKFLILFHLLNIELTIDILNKINTFFVLNLISTYFLYLIIQYIIEYNSNYIIDYDNIYLNDIKYMFYCYKIFSINGEDKNILYYYNNLYPYLVILKLINSYSYELSNVYK